MGSVCDTNSDKSNHHHQHKEMNSLDKSNLKFPDMPLWNNGKKVGFGIK